MTWELYALRYGSQPDLPAHKVALHPEKLPDPDAMTRFAFSFWLARSETTTVLIDCGFNAEQAKERGKTFESQPLDLLSKVGVAPSDIDALILTHLHYDHAGNADLFANTPTHLHLKEWQQATGREMADGQAAQFYDPRSTALLLAELHAGQLQLQTDKVWDVAGLTVECLGGHSPGQCIVHVPTEAGPVVLASDAAHLSCNIAHQTPFPIIHDLPMATAGLSRLAELEASGARVVAGHDAEIHETSAPVEATRSIVALHKEICHV